MELKVDFKTFQESDRLQNKILEYAHIEGTNEVVVRWVKQTYVTIWKQFDDLVTYKRKFEETKNFQEWAKDKGYKYYKGKASEASKEDASFTSGADEEEDEAEESTDSKKPGRRRRHTRENMLIEEEEEKGADKKNEDAKLLEIVRKTLEGKTWDLLLKEALDADDGLGVKILLAQKERLNFNKPVSKKPMTSPKKVVVVRKPVTQQDKSPNRVPQQTALSMGQVVEKSRELIKKGFTREQAVAAVATLTSCSEERLKDHIGSEWEELGRLEKETREKNLAPVQMNKD